MKIDTTVDFSLDTPNFWKEYWKDDVLGSFNNDPDSSSKKLRETHQMVWSRKLPCGKFLKLEMGDKKDYLTWGNFRFGSDTIIISFRYKKNRPFMEQYKKFNKNYHRYIEDYIHKSYTIGGSIIFPKKGGGINQTRGCNPFIKDRFDLTLECIRRYYNGEESPLTKVLEENREFFDLFVDFKGYVNFFFLNDLVDNKFETVKFWGKENNLDIVNPIPKTNEDFELWIENELKFVALRNKRIAEYFNN